MKQVSGLTVCLVLVIGLLESSDGQGQKQGGGMGMFMMSEQQIDAIANKFGLTKCWKYVKDEFFDGEYNPMKILALVPKLPQIIHKLTAPTSPCAQAAKDLLPQLMKSMGSMGAMG